eukprot:TRINITY_DN3783_c0_g1_i1.p1 TRINITY_DN3783_c0_g1~~TRINITY_DN3783_c0_g1_i1.p1  ORF type:complete len:513 (-),score=55.27 TRINITY_DN3783_c0_g1_i1:56-1594(-)
MSQPQQIAVMPGTPGTPILHHNASSQQSNTVYMPSPQPDFSTKRERTKAVQPAWCPDCGKKSNKECEKGRCKPCCSTHPGWCGPHKQGTGPVPDELRSASHKFIKGQATGHSVSVPVVPTQHLVPTQHVSMHPPQFPHHQQIPMQMQSSVPYVSLRPSAHPVLRPSSGLLGSRVSTSHIRRVNLHPYYRGEPIEQATSSTNGEYVPPIPTFTAQHPPPPRAHPRGAPELPSAPSHIPPLRPAHTESSKTMSYPFETPYGRVMQPFAQVSPLYPFPEVPPAPVASRVYRTSYSFVCGPGTQRHGQATITCCGCSQQVSRIGSDFWRHLARCSPALFDAYVSGNHNNIKNFDQIPFPDKPWSLSLPKVSEGGTDPPLLIAQVNAESRFNTVLDRLTDLFEPTDIASQIDSANDPFAGSLAELEAKRDELVEETRVMKKKLDDGQYDQDRKDLMDMCHELKECSTASDLKRIVAAFEERFDAKVVPKESFRVRPVRRSKVEVEEAESRPKMWEAL